MRPAIISPDHHRGPERRIANRGNPLGPERRRIADRRTENNGLYTVFRIGESTFILNIVAVQEVLRMKVMTTVPLAPPLIAGLINLRGQIVPAINLRSALNHEDSRKETDINVVVSSADGAFGLIVEEIDEILEISSTMIVDPPPNLPGYLRSLVRAVCRLPDRILLLLDAQKVAHLVEEACRTSLSRSST